MRDNLRIDDKTESCLMRHRRGLDFEATCALIGRYIDESGMSDKELGERMHISVQAINKWRHGRSMPDIGNLYRLGELLGKSTADFFVPLKD